MNNKAIDLLNSAIRWLKKMWYRLINIFKTIIGKCLIKAKQDNIQGELSDSAVSPELSMKITPVRAGHLVQASRKTKPIRRRGREKVYRLKGYTTIAKVNRRRQSERQQRFLRRLMIGIIVLLLVVLVYNLYNPFTNLGEWYRIIGVKDIKDITSSQSRPSTTQQTTLPGTTVEGGQTEASSQSSTVKTTQP